MAPLVNPLVRIDLADLEVNSVAVVDTMSELQMSCAHNKLSRS